MVKIRLRRLGNKGRPFYRLVVANSMASRDGSFIETLGTYSAIERPKRLEVNAERALYWLRQGAEPTETAAYLLNKDGVLETYLSERPNQRRKFKFLDKRTAAAKAAPAPEAVAAPAREAPAASAPEPATPIEDPKIEAALEAGTVESA